MLHITYSEPSVDFGNMVIGTIVKSNSHVSYLCRIYGRLETEHVPTPEDYAFGRFVSIRPVEEQGVRLIGVVHDTILLNPEYGNLGPRLSTTSDLRVFSPDYLEERGVLVEILVLGWMEGDRPRHTIPPLAAQVGSRVEVLEHEMVVAFHRDESGRFLMGYYPQIMVRNDPIIASLLLATLEQLAPSFPEHAGVIRVLRTNLAWKAKVLPAG
jgi:hypothetical protein